MKESVFEIVHRMEDAGQLHLCHRYHVENINKIYLVIKQYFKRGFIKLD